MVTTVVVNFSPYSKTKRLPGPITARAPVVASRPPARPVGPAALGDGALAARLVGAGAPLADAVRPATVVIRLLRDTSFDLLQPFSLKLGMLFP